MGAGPREVLGRNRESDFILHSSAEREEEKKRKEGEEEEEEET